MKCIHCRGRQYAGSRLSTAMPQPVVGPCKLQLTPSQPLRLATTALFAPDLAIAACLRRGIQHLTYQDSTARVVAAALSVLRASGTNDSRAPDGPPSGRSSAVDSVLSLPLRPFGQQLPCLYAIQADGTPFDRNPAWSLEKLGFSGMSPVEIGYAQSENAQLKPCGAANPAFVCVPGRLVKTAAVYLVQYLHIC